MKKITTTFVIALALISIGSVSNTMADEIKIAVASNFIQAIRSISRRFEADTGHKVTLIFGSTGRHYAQIINGAPFEVFFAADAKRPERLEQDGVALPGSRFTYAIGKVVLWSPQPGVVDKDARVLETNRFRYLAIGNPKLAPYGRAARQIISSRGLWGELRTRMVRGENIGQAFQFVKSGNAELGFIAYSQIKSPNSSLGGSLWVPPQSLYDPIRQQAVLLKDNKVARAFIAFVKGEEALRIIEGYGYGVPNAR